MLDVVALGELLIDFSCREVDDDGYPTMEAHPGGAPANYLAALTEYGAKTAMIGKVGDDAFGRMLLATLDKKGVCTDGMIVSDQAFTTLAFVTLDESGNREFSFARRPGADTQLRYEELRLELIDQARILHFGTLSLTDEPALSTTRRAVEYARQRGKLISFDPNLRKPLWKSLTNAKEQMLWGLSHADLVKISDDEVEFLLGVSAREGAELIVERFGAKLAFVTCGAEGCWFYQKNAKGFVESLRDISVVDTTGAGDIFCGAVESRLLKSEMSPELLGREELELITAFGCTAAGLSTTRPGGISSVPSMAELEKYSLGL